VQDEEIAVPATFIVSKDERIVFEKCPRWPSSLLIFRGENAATRLCLPAMSDENEVKLLSNGPIQIKEPIKLLDHDGAPIPAAKFPIYLCRCGQSARKPFCDGAHKGAAFDGTCARQKHDAAP